MCYSCTTTTVPRSTQQICRYYFSAHSTSGRVLLLVTGHLLLSGKLSLQMIPTPSIKQVSVSPPKLTVAPSSTLELQQASESSPSSQHFYLALQTLSILHGLFACIIAFYQCQTECQILKVICRSHSEISFRSLNLPLFEKLQFKFILAVSSQKIS